MTDFLTRIELHDATEADYVRLDEAMASRNFGKTMRSKRGVAYQMPSATYVSHSDLLAKDVRDLAMAAARTTGCRYDIVTSSGDVAFFLHPAA